MLSNVTSDLAVFREAFPGAWLHSDLGPRLHSRTTLGLVCLSSLNPRGLATGRLSLWESSSGVKPP